MLLIGNQGNTERRFPDFPFQVGSILDMNRIIMPDRVGREVREVLFGLLSH